MRENEFEKIVEAIIEKEREQLDLMENTNKEDFLYHESMMVGLGDMKSAVIAFHKRKNISVDDMITILRGRENAIQSVISVIKECME